MPQSHQIDFQQQRQLFSGVFTTNKAIICVYSSYSNSI